MNFVLCECFKDNNYCCKNWDGKGDPNIIINKIKETCKSEPVKCEYSALLKDRTKSDISWIWGK